MKKYDTTGIDIVYTTEEELQWYFNYLAGASSGGEFRELTEAEAVHRDEIITKFKGNVYTTANKLSPEEEEKLKEEKAFEIDLDRRLKEPLNLSEKTKEKVRGMLADLDWL